MAAAVGRQSVWALDGVHIVAALAWTGLAAVAIPPSLFVPAVAAVGPTSVAMYRESAQASPGAERVRRTSTR